MRVGASHIAPMVKSGNLSASSFPGTTLDVGSASTLAGGLNYMLTDHWAVDLPLALPLQHAFDGGGAIDGVGKLVRTKALPVTLMAQYRFGEANAKIRPYGGRGLAYTKFFKNRFPAALTGVTGGSPANPTTAWIDNKWGCTAGGFCLELQRALLCGRVLLQEFFEDYDAPVVGSVDQLQAKPYVFAVGISCRF